MPKISVLGLGNWGTALGNHLAAKGFEVLGWTKDKSIAQSINTAKKNPKYLAHVTLNPNLKATINLTEALNQDVIVLAFPSSGLTELMPQVKVKPDAIIVSAIKGLEQDTLLTPLQYARKYVNGGLSLAVLSGPSFAKDIVLHRPSGVVAASEDENVAKTVADVFSSDWMKVYVSTDPLGVELGGVVKNVIAIAAGVCDGLDLGSSARAGLITRGLAEMMRLAEAMGAEVRTLTGLSGLGDLVVSATSDASRNRTVGFRLGKGEKLNYIIETLGSVAEGIHTTPLVLELAKRYKLEMPITLRVAKLLNGEIAALEAVKELVTRPMKREY